MMNYRLACSTLGFKETDDITMQTIKKQYRLQALLYHPDKNDSPDASLMFHKIREAYEYLLSNGCDEEFTLDEDEWLNEEEPEQLPGYMRLLLSLLKNILSTDSQQTVIFTIIEKIVSVCENKALQIVGSLDKQLIIKIYEIIKKYQSAFHFSGDFLKGVENILMQKMKQDECIILNPSLTDLLSDNVYRLSIGEHNFMVPLWHDELVYDNSGVDIYVNCIPILPDNITIDDMNNIYVSLEFRIYDLWGKDKIIVDIGGKMLSIIPSTLYIRENQTVVFAKEGIARPKSKMVYDVSDRGDIIANIIIRGEP